MAPRWMRKFVIILAVRSQTAEDFRCYNGFSPWLCASVRVLVLQSGRDERSTLFADLGLCVRNWFEGKRRLRA